VDALAFGLKELCARGRDGSFATQSERGRILAAMAADLKAGGFKLPGAASLKPKHVEFLIERWRADGITDRTMKNRMGALRWWAEKVDKASVVMRANEAYGIEDSGDRRARAYTLDAERLAAVPSPLVRLSLELQAAFGLRREESIKFRVAVADHGDHIRLRPSWTKGGRGRSVPVVTAAQRELLDRIKATVGGGSLIPADMTYVQQRRVYEHQTLAVGLRNTHGLRHAWAQERYRQLTGWASPIAGGPNVAVMGAAAQRLDRRARLQLSQELGHNRIEITKVYLG
jgi:integrase